jgi:TIR domain
MAKKEKGSQRTAFVSYSHRDERFRASLETHLAILKRNGVLKVWHDRKITPGFVLDEEIDSNLRTADLIIVLVSPDFIASDYCYSMELRLAMELHASGRARVVPVILRPVDWRDAPFSKLVALPTDAKPITTWNNRDKAFLNVTDGIRKLLDERERCVKRILQGCVRV